jgi:hypothetical protein
LRVRAADLRAYVALDRGGISRPHAAAKLPAGARDGDVLAAPVDGALLARDETRLLEPVDEPGSRVLRQEHVPLELERAKPPLRRPVELEEGVIPGERGKASRLQLRFDGIEERARDADEPGPGLERRFGGVCIHADNVLIRCNCIKLDSLCTCIYVNATASNGCRIV